MLPSCRPFFSSPPQAPQQVCLEILMLWWSVNRELGMVRKQAAVAWFQVPFRYLPKGLREIKEIRQVLWPWFEPWITGIQGIAYIEYKKTTLTAVFVITVVWDGCAWGWPVWVETCCNKCESVWYSEDCCVDWKPRAVVGLNLSQMTTGWQH
jgi:hypothetical protein